MLQAEPDHTPIGKWIFLQKEIGKSTDEATRWQIQTPEMHLNEA